MSFQNFLIHLATHWERGERSETFKFISKMWVESGISATQNNRRRHLGGGKSEGGWVCANTFAAFERKEIAEEGAVSDDNCLKGG